MALTAMRRRALAILDGQSGLMMAATFADKMWPDTRRKSAQGSGFAGGGYLGKLVKLGLVRFDTVCSSGGRYTGWGYKITAAGRRALRDG